MIGAAILLFVCVIVVNSMKSINTVGDITNGPQTGNTTEIANRAEWNNTNATYNQIKTFLTVSAVLLAILGIVMIGSQIIAYIGGSFGA